MSKASANNGAGNNGAVIESLKTVLGSTFLLAMKTHGFHWNVEGPLFPQLHAMFEDQYKALYIAADDVAERLRALKEFAPGSGKQFTGLSDIKEETGILSADKMIAALHHDYGILIKDIHEGVEAADMAEDDATNDLLSSMSREMQKTAWMLRASMK
jgi:starvation-inducible DNA-binding protein